MERTSFSTRETMQNSVYVCPFGWSFALPLSLTALAVSFTWMATYSCKIVRSTGYLTLDDVVETDQEPEPITVGIGPWKVQDFTLTKDGATYLYSSSDSCVSWDSHTVLGQDELDGSLITARVISLMTSYIGLTFFCYLLFGSFLRLKPCHLQFMTVVFITFGVLMMVTLKMTFDSKWCSDAKDCELDTGAYFIIGAFLLWVAAGFTLLNMKDRKYKVHVARMLSSSPAPSSPIQPTGETEVASGSATEGSQESTTRVPPRSTMRNEVSTLPPQTTPDTIEAGEEPTPTSIRHE
mmetsp:Transcript_29911/g.82100  ORF Transcript_29911/g.82100 Transcript_29911/m.82100 type:complete len:294 (+) Transcript_29911:131-1012(+)